MHFLLSSIDPQAQHLAREYGLGLEIAQFCTAANMDGNLSQITAQLRQALDGAPRCTLHAPFNELFPCAIDPKARALAADRYRQAIALARDFGAEKVVIHGGYHPWIYFPQWYTEQSILFWREFLREDPGLELVLENVLEPDPALLMQIVQGVDSPRLGLCLDVGHANVYSKQPLSQWLACFAPRLRHLHLHNNDGSWDTHSPLFQGGIPIAELLRQLSKLTPEITVTLELPDAGGSLRWLREQNFL